MSLHTDAHAVLTSWAPADDRQRRLRDKFVAHLEACPDGVRRSSFPDHLTAGTLVLDQSLDRVLLNLHGKAKRWFAFGGHCEASDATLAGAAWREAMEESGLTDLRFDPAPVQLAEHAVAFCDPRGVVNHLDVRYAAMAPDHAAHSASEESLDVRWWPVDGLPELEPEMHHLIDLARRRFSSARQFQPVALSRSSPPEAEV